MLTQPDDHLRSLVTSEVVPHQQDPQWRELFGQGEAHRQAVLPRLPERAGHRGIARDAGSAAMISSKVSRNHLCKIALVVLATGRTRTWPVAGWNRVRTLIVPSRTYSPGGVVGPPSGCQWLPGWGMA